jgi:Flp pilus assembly protein TadG
VRAPKRRSALRERGAAAVELAIVLPLLLLVIGGIVDFGRAFYTQIVISNAAREGARMMAVGGYSTSQVTTRTQLATASGLPSPPSVTLSACATEAATGLSVARVTVSAPFQWLIVRDLSSFFGSPITLPSTLTATGSMRCEQ